MQEQIMNFVGTEMDEMTMVEAVLNLIEQLPIQNVATLGFLMRQLKKVCSLYFAEISNRCV